MIIYEYMMCMYIYHLSGIEAIWVAHRCKLRKCFAYFSKVLLTSFQLKYALISAIVRLSPTKKVLSLSRSSRDFATFVMISLAFAIWTSLTSVNSLLFRIITPTAGSNYFSINSNHWFISAFIRAKLLVGML